MVVLTFLLFSTIILLVIIKYLVTVLHEHPSIFCTFENKERDLLLFLGKSRLHSKVVAVTRGDRVSETVTQNENY